MDLSTNLGVFEKKIIGGILSGAVKAETIDLTPHDLPELGIALTVCRELEAKGIKPDPESVYANIIERNPDECFFSVNDYRLFAESAQSGAVVFESIDRIKANSLRTYLTQKIASLATDESQTGASLLDELKSIIATADSKYRSSENNFLLMSEIVPKLEAVYKDFYSGVSYAVPTGFPILDDLLLDGFAKGDLHIVVGLTGAGKSAFALNCARYQASAGYFVGIVSREMSDVENLMRLQSSQQQIPRWQMKRGVYESTYRQLCDGFEQLRQLPIAFDVRTSDIGGLRMQVKRMVEQYEMKILYVDYLQLVGVSKTRGSRAEDVAAVSRGMKEIAMENNIPVFALSQFNRGAINADVMDLLGHLKESSGIEQDASTVTYIQVDNSDVSAKRKQAKLYVLKNRNGMTFKPVYYDYHGEVFTFTETGGEN